MLLVVLIMIDASIIDANKDEYINSSSSTVGNSSCGGNTDTVGIEKDKNVDSDSGSITISDVDKSIGK